MGEFHLDKTQVKVYFSLYGDDFPIDNVTEILGIKPTNSYKKGDVIPKNIIQMLFQLKSNFEKKPLGNSVRTIKNPMM